MFIAHPPMAVACTVCVVASVGYAATLMLQQRLMALTPDDLKGHALGLHSSCMLAMQGVGAALAGRELRGQLGGSLTQLAAPPRSADHDAMTQNQDLRAELLRRFEWDQTARRASTTAGFEAVTRVDAENLPWLKQVIAQIGWPGQSEVGVDGAHAAWLLVQHADADPQFQRRCLDLLTAAAEQGEATSVEVAYLTDRVLLAEGKPQEFGTQATAEDGRWVPCRLRDPDTVDQRRSAVPLEPMAEYLARMTQNYGPPQPAVLTCPQCGGPVEFSMPDHGQEVAVDCPGCGLAIKIAPST